MRVLGAQLDPDLGVLLRGLHAGLPARQQLGLAQQTHQLRDLQMSIDARRLKNR